LCCVFKSEGERLCVNVAWDTVAVSHEALSGTPTVGLSD
jgi:hypothetical protein